MWQSIGAIFGVVKEWLGWQSKIHDRKNAPDMLSNKKAEQDLREKEKIQEVVEKGDFEKERELYG